jgi:hypothetical protein
MPSRRPRERRPSSDRGGLRTRLRPPQRRRGWPAEQVFRGDRAPVGARAEVRKDDGDDAVHTPDEDRLGWQGQLRATIVELTDSGKALADQVKQLWRALAEETATGLPDETLAELPGILQT